MVQSLREDFVNVLMYTSTCMHMQHTGYLQQVKITMVYSNDIKQGIVYFNSQHLKLPSTAYPRSNVTATIYPSP